MQLSVIRADDIFVCAGECGNCGRGENSFIIVDGKQLSPRVMSVNIVCVCCNSSYTAKVKVEKAKG